MVPREALLFTRPQARFSLRIESSIHQISPTQAPFAKRVNRQKDFAKLHAGSLERRALLPHP